MSQQVSEKETLIIEDRTKPIQDWEDLPFFHQESNLSARGKFREMNNSNVDFHLVDAVSGGNCLIFGCNESGNGVLHVYDENYQHVGKEPIKVFDEIRKVKCAYGILAVIGVTSQFVGQVETKTKVEQLYCKIYNMGDTNIENRFKKPAVEFPLVHPSIYSFIPKEKISKDKVELDVNTVDIIDVDISPSKKCIAVALGSKYDTGIDCKVILLQGDLLSSKPKHNSFTMGAKITGIRFCRKRSDTWNADLISMFVTTESSVYKFDNVETAPQEVSWDSTNGCEPLNLTLNSNYIDQRRNRNKYDRLVMTTKNEILFYGPEEKERWTYWIEKDGTKHKIAIPCMNPKGLIQFYSKYQQYLFVVHKEFQTSVRGYLLDHEVSAINYLVDSGKNVVAILQEFGNLYLILEASSHAVTILQFEEKSNRQKIDILVQNSRYASALQIADQENFSPDVKAEIEKQFGDYDFINKNWEAAIHHYTKTIGILEPSYVIRKFLKENQTSYLITYLEHLHKSKRHNPYHTVLLLKCYTKEPNVKSDVEASLMKFIENFSKDIEPNLSIKTLREFGYLKHAILLAKEVRAHDWFIKINLEDFPDNSKDTYLTALQYIETLEFDYAQEFMKKYAHQFVQKIPKQTTNLLIRLCVAYYPVSERYNGSRKLERDSNLNYEQTKTSGQVIKKKVYIDVEKVGVFGNKYIDRVEKEEIIQEKEYIPKFALPDAFISAYLTEPFWLMVFLENVIERSKLSQFRAWHMNEKDKTLMIPLMCYNTLLELYLYFWDNREKLVLPTFTQPYKPFVFMKKEDESEDTSYDIYPCNEQNYKMPYEDKIINLLSLEDAKYIYLKGELDVRSKDKQDQYPMLLQALVLCQSRFFERGILFIYERMGLYYDILKYHMNRFDLDNLKNALTSLSEKSNPFDSNPSLKRDEFMYSFVLKYLVELRISEDPHVPGIAINDKIKAIIAEAQHYNLLSPLEIIDILNPLGETNTKQKVITFDLIKEYLEKTMEMQLKTITENNEYIKKNHVETSKIRTEIEESLTTATTFTSQKCSSAKCGLPLDLPLVHFMCKHSYHARCLTERHCPKCWERDIKQRRRYDELFRDESKSVEEFEKNLKQKGNDGIIEFYGKGIFLERKIRHDMYYDSFEPVVDEHEEEYERKREKELYEQN